MQCATRPPTHTEAKVGRNEKIEISASVAITFSSIVRKTMPKTVQPWPETRLAARVRRDGGEQVEHDEDGGRGRDETAEELRVVLPGLAEDAADGHARSVLGGGRADGARGGGAEGTACYRPPRLRGEPHADGRA